MSDQEVVIVGKDGKEHVFPAGFDPKRAAGIVAQSTKPKEPREPGLATIGEHMAAKTTGEKIGGMTGTAVDLSIGALKGVGNTVFGLGKIVHDYTPVGRISDAIYPNAFEHPERNLTDVVLDRQRTNPIIDALQPSNTTQRVGYTGEQIGEFFVPMSKVAKLGTAGQMARSGLQTLAQSGSPTDAAVSAGLTAVLPGASAAAKGVKALRGSAEKSAAQALGATKEWAKSEASKLAPEMIERGVKGTREAMLEAAKAQTQTINTAIGEVIKDAAARGTIVEGKVARESIKAAQQALMIPSANGKAIPIEGAQAALGKLQRLDKFVERLGDAIPIEDAQRVKVAWDKIVSKAGLYGPKATASATDNAEAWAIREAAGSFRKLLAEASPDLAALNKEFAFWGGLKNVLKETQKRTQSQGSGLVSGITGATGAAAGFASGDGLGDSLEKAVVGGAVGSQVVKLIQSPWFRTNVSAQAKNFLADALASGHTGKILDAVKKITVAMPAQVRTAQ